MDFNDLDDVSLAPLIKKASVPDVVTEKSTDHVLSVHSQGSSSSEGVFIPTPDLHHTSFIEPGPSPHSHRLGPSFLTKLLQLIRMLTLHVPLLMNLFQLKEELMFAMTNPLLVMTMLLSCQY